MFYWCYQYNVCHNKKKTSEKESVNDIFSVIYQYWHKAPKVICSDFQCVAAIYQSNREPEYFRYTINIVDAFHSRGHKACSSAIHAQQFKNSHPGHTHMNDSGLWERSFLYVLFFCLPC